MVTKHILQTFGVFAFRFICKKVNLLVKRHGFARLDRDDLLQSFALNLHARSAKFDPGVASWEAFVVVVCENHFVDILEHRSAEMRSRSREEGSLNRKVDDGDNNACDRASQLDESHHSRRTGARFRPGREWFEMCDDLQGVVAGLSEIQRRICAGLMRHGSVSSVARELGLSRWAVKQEMTRIRQRFEQADLRDYL